jgi:MFS family permease
MSKLTALILLCTAVVFGLAPWFATSAALPDMVREGTISPTRQALLSSMVQAGFVIGALGTAVTGLPDRFDPRRVMAIAAFLNACFTFGLLLAPLGGDVAITLRFLSGACFAGIYPVGMKMAVGWGQKDRGLLVGVVVGALTFGSSTPHLAAWLGGADWRMVIAAAACASLFTAIMALFTGLGPYHARAPQFSARSIGLMWTDKRIRAATGGYLGHMWELYVMWGWIGAASAAGYAMQMNPEEATNFAASTAFAAIAIGAVTCVVGGVMADRIGKAEVAGGAMVISGGPVWLSFVLILIWGAFVVPDSPQFSALIADAAPPEVAGSLMAVQTALGFGLTIITVQAAPLLAGAIGWPWTLGVLALGPVFGVWALRPLFSASR